MKEEEKQEFTKRLWNANTADDIRAILDEVIEQVTNINKLK